MNRCYFDVDGVVLDFDRGFTKTMKEYFKLDIDDDYVPGSFWYSDLLTKEQVVEGWDYFIKSEEFERLKPIVDPKHFNAKFGAYPVHFITNIPPDCLDRRVRNLLNAGFKFKSAHCGGFINYEGKKSKTKAEVIKELLKANESVFFVDDHPDNCLNVLESFPDSEIWLISRPFNADFQHPRIRRANDWSEVLKHSGTPASN
tara:strand:- start:25 stop:627 length:603 start_codon:yes stop_codon:yes gene_type:complete